MASALTKLVFPTPGLPSSNIALFNCNPLSNLSALNSVVGAVNVNLSSGLTCLPLVIKNGLIPNSLSFISTLMLSKLSKVAFKPFEVICCNKNSVQSSLSFFNACAL